MNFEMEVIRKMDEEEIKYAKKCLKEAQKESNTEIPDFTSWCGSYRCDIVNILLKDEKEIARDWFMTGWGNAYRDEDMDDVFEKAWKQREDRNI